MNELRDMLDKSMQKSNRQFPPNVTSAETECINPNDNMKELLDKTPKSAISNKSSASQKNFRIVKNIANKYDEFQGHLGDYNNPNHEFLLGHKKVRIVPSLNRQTSKSMKEISHSKSPSLRINLKEHERKPFEDKEDPFATTGNFF